MCGIVGYIGNQKATPILLNGLSALEYRGYDSAGIAVLEKNNICILKYLYKEQSQGNGNNRRYQAGHHKRMIQHILADFCCPGTVEIDSSHYSRVIRNKEISVYCRKQGDQHIRRNPQRNAQRHKCPNCGSLAV